MKPYCPNNSNFTFREITCAPVKKPCDKQKNDCDCRNNNGFGFCDELLNCFSPPNSCPFCGRHDTNPKNNYNCDCNKKTKCDCDKKNDCTHKPSSPCYCNPCDNCYPCYPPPDCCKPQNPCENHIKRTPSRRPIIIILKNKC